jgi:hypothetical protein
MSLWDVTPCSVVEFTDCWRMLVLPSYILNMSARVPAKRVQFSTKFTSQKALVFINTSYTSQLWLFSLSCLHVTVFSLQLLAKFYVCGVDKALAARVSLLSGVPKTYIVLKLIVDSIGLDSVLGDFAVTSVTVVIVDSRSCLRHCSTRVILFSFVAERYRIWLGMFPDCINL